MAETAASVSSSNSVEAASRTVYRSRASQSGGCCCRDRCDLMKAKNCANWAGVHTCGCHLGIGRPHAGTRVLLLVQDLNIRVINADTGELLRELVLDPSKSYQATGRRPGWPQKNTANST